ncbi:unnamed protein product [Acanthoscelides obtectus]|uniref:Uncharacterized protein n=1 Tax=Acanthoscelides obtectus TaxID=200917 RepID=A0A9P0Q368_ACAOB|nr:unnamed protein product [Acanthoscelides obtectus]CAK1627213.1 hypothetical protein AOBTE_LOCUS4396 [Acanthoscelides obtectus]
MQTSNEHLNCQRNWLRYTGELVCDARL